jgi:UDP-N-acetylglucosamine transferase subunit ALG13
LIFVTVGTQLPFDRLVSAIDEWARRSGRGDVFAQTGPTRLKPGFIRHEPFLDACKFQECIERADAVIAHAGMGSIITALELGKPILVMPRRADLGEHRNDHQMATARRFHQQGRIAVAFDQAELLAALDHLDELPRPQRIDSGASPMLIERIRSFVNGHEADDSTRRTKCRRADASGSAEHGEWAQLIGRKMGS